LFNPQIGESIKPLAETTSVFVQLIAMVFAMNGLFPKNHPGLTGELTADGKPAKLSLSEIIGTAWRDLSFTKAGAPKVALFFAVTGTLVLAVISIITALLAGFMGTAHAATATAASGGFFSSAGTSDLAQNWLDYIFNGQPLSQYYSQNGTPIPQTTGIQCAMITALGFYSSAMLIFAAFILAYHLVSMIVNTAHEGVAMGKKANQVWAPIRLVVAIGLLIPMGASAGSQCSTGTGAGLNAGQFIVIQMASWGSGLASQTWKKFVTTLATAQNKPIQPSPPDSNELVTNMVMMEACKFAWNYQVCVASENQKSDGDPSQCQKSPESNISSSFSNEQMLGPKDSGAPAPVTDPNTGDVTYAYTVRNQADVTPLNICGTYTIPGKLSNTVGDTMGQTDASAATASQLSSVQQSTFTNELPNFQKVGIEIAQVLPGATSSTSQATLTANQDLASEVDSYESTLNSALSSALGSGSTSSGLLDSETITDMGWAGAGAWLNTIARDQGSVISAYQDGMPKTRRPDLTALIGKGQGTDISVAQATARALGHFTQLIESGYVPQCEQQAAASAGGSPGVGVVNTPGTVGTVATNPNSVVPDSLNTNNNKMNLPDTASYVKDLASKLSGGKASGTDIMQNVFAVIDAQAVRSGIWQTQSSSCGNNSNPQYFTLGAQLTTANPLQEFSFWGFANLRASYSLWGDILQLSVAEVREGILQQVTQFAEGMKATNNEQQHIQDIGLLSKSYGFVASIFSLFANVFFVCGFTIAFVVPLLPYFRFFFSILTWIVSVLEAIVAIPLLALAHLNPEGEGLPGQSAKAGYFMIFNIFLRPVLTIFGLIAGLIVFYISIMLLNLTFAVAVAGTNAGYHSGIETLVRIAYTIMYGATVYVCANNAFKPIGFFSEHALRWIGAQAHHERMGDGGRAVQGVMGQAQGQLGEKAVGVIRLKPPG
jgi:conjugal transfer/type IV secretion protein DotA/TraY